MIAGNKTEKLPADFNQALETIKFLQARLEYLQDERNMLEAELEQILNSSNHPIRIINADKTIRRINEPFAALANIRAQDARGKKCWEVYKGPLCNSTSCDLEQVFKGKKVVRTLFEHVNPDGTITSYTGTSVPFRNRKSKIIGITETYRDISRRKKLSSLVTETEGRYRSLVELSGQVGEAIIVMQDINNQKAIQTYVSREWENITGYSRKELIGMPLTRLIKPGEKGPMLQRHSQKMSGISLPGKYEISIRTKTGCYITVELTSAHSTYNGQPANVAYIRDITERKKTENELALYRRKLVSMVAKRTARLEQMNHKLKAEIKKRAQAENRYRFLFEKMPVPMIETDWSEIKKGVDKIKNAGFNDIEGFLKNNPSVFNEIFAKYRFRDANKAFARFWGVSSTSDFNIHSKEILDHWISGETIRVTRHLMAAVANNRTKCQYHWSTTNLKGKPAHCINVFYAPRGHKGDYSRVLELIQDLSNEKQLEKHVKALLKSEKRYRVEIERQFKQRVDFINSLVHELKTPLTPMICASETLMNQETQFEFHKLARNIYNGSLQLNKRIDELLDLARGELGLLIIKPETLDAKVILRETAGNYRDWAGRKHVGIILKLPREKLEIYADAERLKQILQNLLDNAVRHAPAGTSIIITARQTESFVEFQVRDSGPGVPADMRNRLFEPYYHKPEDTLKLTGLGLGLALCRMFVELHSGYITYHHLPGQGSVFSLTLPRKERT
ncbi:MAG: PAS domain S-box protein [Dehalococcoidaceae bacterium]|nr:PAS domain S-box protein [Dehalococcoidaceae bacterium]